MPNHSETRRGSSPATAESERSLRAAMERELGASEEARHPPAIPDHELLRRIGSGAYGDVWLARSALGTLRAVKVVYRARFEDAHPYEREFNGILKYEPISRTHEGLVQVLHVGRNDDAGCFYYVMELADAAGRVSSESVIGESVIGESVISESVKHVGGATELLITDSLITEYSPRTLRSELKQRQRLSPTDAAQLTQRLAGALAHLHSHGLVHRDIKPGNVIFVNGQPKLADIGLVAVAGDSRSFVGTEGFVPPEGPGSVQGDIYALGKLLYELASGRDRMEFPQLPDLPPGPEREALLELNEIITRAAAPALGARYASAEQLNADLQLFLAGRSLRATRKNERQLVLMKRVALAATGCVVVALALAGASRWQEQQAERRAATESSLRVRAEAAEAESRRQLFTALLEQARATARSGAVGQRVHALDAVRRAAAISNSVDLQFVAIAALALPDLRFEREWRGGGDINAVHFDPAFKLMSVSRGTNAVEIRSVADFQLLATLAPAARGASFRSAWTSDGKCLVVKRDHDSSGGRADLEVWKVDSRERIALVRDVPREALSVHPSLPRLAAGTPAGEIDIWDLERGEKIKTLPAMPALEVLEYSPDGRRLAVVHSTGGWRVALLDAAEGGQLRETRFSSRVSTVAWQPRGHLIAVADYNGAVHMMDSVTGAASVMGRHKATAFTLAFTPDGRYLVSGGWDNELICWDASARERSFAVHAGAFAFFVAADGRQCAIVKDGDVRLHSFESPAIQRTLSPQLGDNMRHAAFSPDGRWLAASGGRGMAVWDMTKENAGVVANEASEARPHFIPDSKELFGSSREDACFRWRIVETVGDGPPGLERLPLTKPAGFTALTVASNRLVWTGRKGSRVASLDEDEDRDEWTSTSPGVSRASADGRWLAVFRPFTPSLHVYELPSLKRAGQFTAQANISLTLFTPDGNEVGATARGTTEFWNVRSGERTRVLTNTADIVFLPDGAYAWMRRERSAGLYRLDTLEPLLLLPGDAAPLALSPDGRFLAVSIERRRLQLWDLAKARLQLRELGLRTEW